MNQNAVRVRSPSEQLALWLATNQPQVFKALTVEAQKHGKLAGITDWLSSVGTSVGSAVQSVGSFLTSPQGLTTLGTLGTVYLQSQAQRDALKIQTAQAQAGYGPQPIYSAGTNGQLPYYVDPRTGQQIALNSALTNQLLPKNNYLPWIIGGGLLVGVVLFLK